MSSALNTGTNASSLLAALKTKTSAEVNSAPLEQQFQQYKSAKSAVRFVTHAGLRLTFTNFQFLTQSPDAIDYLDSEIARGLQGVTKGGILATSDLDPMQSMRKQARAELLAELEQEAKDEAEGLSKNMGATQNKAQISPASTKTVVSR
tara:strand:+ start:203 stop:649 length:447 start_codon:yes stop_codon:yes gene_type:complete